MRSLKSLLFILSLFLCFSSVSFAEGQVSGRSLDELDFSAYGGEQDDAQSVGTDSSIEALINLDALEEEESLDDLLKTEVTVASTKGSTVFNSPSTVTVINASTISKYNFLSVAEAVRQVAGFDVSRTYLKKNMPTARGILQPHYANKVLVLINNVPLWHAVTGEANLERVNIRDVKQIEVLKGPASVKYGTNAYSGAINIVLKSSPEKRKGQYYLGAGGDGRYLAGMNISMPSSDKKTQNHIYANFENYDGYNFEYTGEDAVTGNIQEFVENTNFTWSHKSGNSSILANIYDGAESYLGVVPRLSRGAGIDHELSGRMINYTHDFNFSSSAKLRFTGTYDWNERILARSDTDASDVTGYRLTGGLVLTRTPSEKENWDFGFEYDDRTSKSYRNYVVDTNENLGENNLNDKGLSEYSFFGAYNWNSDKVNGSAGIRWTDNEEFGTNTSFNLSLVRPLSDNRSLKFIYAQSFRTPSLFEFNFETGSGTVYGNLDLEPEKCSSIELAYLQKKGNFFFQTTVYNADYENKILRTRGDGISPTGNPFTDSTHYVNGEDFSALGFEFEARYNNPRFRGVNGILNLGYIDGDDDDRFVNGTDTEVYNFLSVSDVTAMLGVDKVLGDEMSTSFALNYRNSSKDTEGNKVPSATTVDFNLRHRKPKSNSFLDFSVKNLFDNEAWIPEYARPGSDLDAVPGIGYGREVVVTYTRKF